LKKIILATSLACFAVLFAGCSMAQKTQEGATVGEKTFHVTGQEVGMKMNSVAILDKSLQKWTVYENTADGTIHHGTVGKIAVESSGAKRNETGTVKTWAVLRNRTDFPMQVEARAQFFDEMQVPVEAPSSWQRIVLPPNAIGAFKENSLGIRDIKYYYIEVREAR